MNSNDGAYDLGQFILKSREKLDDENFILLLNSLKEVLERNANLKTEVAQIRKILINHKDLFQQFFFLVPSPIRDTLILSELILSQDSKSFDPSATYNNRQHSKIFLKTIARLNYIQYIDFLEMLIDYNENPSSTSFSFVLRQVETIFQDYPQIVLGLSKFFCGNQAKQLESLHESIKENKLQRNKAKNLKRPRGVMDIEETEKPNKVNKGIINNKSIISVEPQVPLDPNEIDLSSINLDLLERVDTNYVKLPEEVHLLYIEQSDELSKKVVNNTLMICPGNTRRYTSSTPNEFAKVLIILEDDQYELDILIEVTKATICRIEQLMDMVEKLKPEKAFNIDALFPVVYRKCIENAYDGIEGKENFSCLYTNPASVIHEILSVLVSKLQDYQKAKKDWGVTWRGMYKKYSAKAMHHTG